MTATRSPLLLALLAIALLAGCGGDDTTTVISETTTTVAADSSSTMTPDEDEDSDDSDDDGPDDDAGPILTLEAFQSPSGNIACVMTGRSARCDISERVWNPPARPADCQGDYGQGIELPAEGSATLVCAGDTVLNPEAPVLEYGSSSHVGLITCHSDEEEIECENESGGGFSLSRDEYDLN